MSLQVSSGGWSGVVSMALAESAGDDDEACVSGFFSLFVLFCSGGGLGGCAEDMVVGYEGRSEFDQARQRTRK